MPRVPSSTVDQSVIFMYTLVPITFKSSFRYFQYIKRPISSSSSQLSPLFIVATWIAPIFKALFLRGSQRSSFPVVNEFVLCPGILSTPCLFKSCWGLGANSARFSIVSSAKLFLCQWAASPILTTLPIHPGLGLALSSGGLLPQWLGL